MQPVRASQLVEPQSMGQAMAEFFGALGNPLTYSPRRNHEVVFGFLWGMPVPFFALLIHAYASGCSLNAASLCQVALHNPLYIYFFLHPLLFAAIFGALGTMRAHREQRIQFLLKQVNTHCEELTRANCRLEELDRLKSEFLANVTHELKSPLVTALGYTDRILKGHMDDITEKQKKGLEVSKRNLTRLRELIEEILDFSRLESGMSRFNMQSTTLNAAIQTAVENAALKIRERRLTVAIESPSTRASVYGDAAKLLQVIVNLLDNAIKFSPDGSHIQIVLERVADRWRLSVIDHGCGIPQEKLPQLFNRFFQADGSLSRNHDGVGLGMVIVKKIIEAHAGSISVESKTGADSGTSVIVELPAVDARKTPGAVENIEREVAHATNSDH